MRKLLIGVVMVLAVGAISGCTAVISDAPVGEKPVVLVPAEWEGKWLVGGEWATIRVLDAEQGLIEFAAPDMDTKKPLHVSIRQSGDWSFANIPVSEVSDKYGPAIDDEDVTKEEKAKESYLWGRIKNEDNQIVFWAPDADKLEVLVEGGKLPGETGPEVVLKGLAADHINLIMSEEGGVLFEWDKPIAMVREKPAQKAEALPAEETTEK